MGSVESKEKHFAVNPELFSHMPVAFALMEVKRKNGAPVNVSYAYVNERFCNLSLRLKKDFLGKDISEVHGEKAKETWLNYIATINKTGEAIKGTCYYAPLDGNVDYIISATDDPNYYAVIYMSDLVKQKEYRKLRKEKLINEKILNLAQKISASSMDSESLSSLLKEIGQQVGAQRVYFNKFGRDRQILALYKESLEVSDPIPPTDEMVTTLLPLAESTGEPLILTEEKAAGGDEISKRFLSKGIKTHMAFPFLSEGRLIACLCADNYPVEKEEEAKKILQNACFFMSFKWSNTLLLQKLRFRARHDQLTGLLNRYGYNEAIKRHLETQQDAPSVLGLIDIDDFKNINDLYGHQAGDIALQSLSADLVSFFGEEAICGRYGGDEISILLPNFTSEKAEVQFKKFISQSHSFETKEGSAYLSFSIGFAEYPKQGNDLPSLMAKADEACYAAKLAGKGCCFAYREEFDELDKTTLGFNFHSIADNLPVPFFLFGDQGELYYANAFCLELLGQSSLFSLALKSKEGVYSFFKEKDALKDFLKEESKEKRRITLTLVTGKTVELVFCRQNDFHASIHYAVLVEK